MRIAARTGSDKAAGTLTNVMLDIDGLGVLGSKNRAPNRALKDFDVRDFPLYWNRLGHLGAYTGWNWYAAGPVRTTFQNSKTYVVNDYVTPKVSNGRKYRVSASTGATQAAGEPAWTKVTGGSVVSGGATFLEAGNDENFPAASRQNDGILPADRPADVARLIVPGDEMPDATRSLPLPRLAAPIVEVVSTATAGFRAGFYPFALAPVVGDPTRRRRRRIGKPGPVKVAQCSQGQTFSVRLPDAVATGVTGVAILQGAWSATEAGASGLPVKVIAVVDVRGSIEDYVSLAGPWKNGLGISGANDTYIGARNQWGPVLVDTPSGYGDIGGDFETNFSYRIRTRFGASRQQQRTGLRIIQKGKHRRCEFRPRNVPWDAVQWEPHFLGPDGQWYALSWRDISEPALIFTNDPEKWPQIIKPTQIEVEDLADETGVPAFEEEIAEILATGLATPLPGTYDVYQTLQYGPDEGPPSSRRRVTIAAGQTFKVYKPRLDDGLANSHFEMRDPGDADQPLDWTRPALAGVTHVPGGATASRGRHKIQDRSAAVTDNDAFLSRTYELTPGQPAAYRFRAEVSGMVAGRVQMLLRETRTGGATTDYSLGTLSVNGTTWFEGSAGFAGNGAAISLGATAESIRIVARHLGAGTAGRNFDVDVTHVAIFPGLAVPRKRFADGDRARVSNLEPEEESYPRFGYLKVVESPDWLPPSLVAAGHLLNAFEYFGPYGTPASENYGPAGLKVPVAPGQAWSHSVYAWWAGVTQPMSPLRCAFKDAAGVTVGDSFTLGTNLSGSSASSDGNWIRLGSPGGVNKVAPVGAAYVEVVGGGLSDGLVRLCAFQFELGAAITSFTAANALTGEIITPTLDTGIPLGPAGSAMGSLDGIRRVIAGIADATLDPAGGTSVVFSWQGRNRGEAWPAGEAGWEGSALALTKTEQVRVRAQLSTTDATRSPAVYDMGIDVERYYAAFLRSDGSEFDGGAIAVNLSPTLPYPAAEDRFFADGGEGFRVLGPEKSDATVVIQCHYDHVAAEIVRLCYEGEGVFVIEDLGKRLVVRPLGRSREAPPIRFGQPERERWFPQGLPAGYQEAGGYELVSDTVALRVRSEAVL